MPKNQNIWWGPPRKFTEKLHERKISWLELFYDLVYIAVISQLTHHLSLHLNATDLLRFCFFFALIYWSWLNGSSYHDIHGSEGLRTRYFTLIQMLAVTALAVTIEDAWQGNHRSFAISFTHIQAIITYLWYNVGYYDKSHRVLNRSYRIHYGIGILLFFSSIFCDFATAIYLWSAALFFNYSVLFVAAPTTQREFKKLGMEYETSASIIERLGLFTIIVLGESIFGIVRGISAVSNKDIYTWIAFIEAIGITFLLWWIYFDLLGDRKAKSGYWNFVFLCFINFPLLTCFGILGASMSTLISSGGDLLQSNARIFFGAAVSMILICIYFLTRIVKYDEQEKTLMKRLSLLVKAGAFAIFVLTFINQYISSIAFLTVIFITLSLPVYIGIKLWVRYLLFQKQ